MDGQSTCEPNTVGRTGTVLPARWLSVAVFSDLAPRRGAMRAVGGVGLALLAALGLNDASGADRQRHRNKRKARKVKNKPNPPNTPHTGPTGPTGPTGTAGPAGLAGATRTPTCPADTSYVAAVGCVETSIRGGGRFDEAWADCKAVGRRLMTANELLALPDSFEVGNEWSGTMWEDGGAKMAMVVSANGNYFGRSTTNAMSLFAIRCMQLP